MNEAVYKAWKQCDGVSIDSRTVKEGELFFALKGPTFNGNMYAAKAIEEGAVMAVIDDPAYQTEGAILVDDTLEELQKLASGVRAEVTAKVIAITGSNGKTTTRELIASVLAKKYRVFASQKNLNNHIGLPLTILNAPAGTEILVLEMGANKKHDIEELCMIARPHIGIITNIGKAHIEGFGSLEGVKETKAELYNYLRDSGGVALYNETDRLLSNLIHQYVVKAVPYSDPAGIDLYTETRRDELLLTGKLIYEEQQYRFRTNLFGAHNHENIRAAIATGLFFDVPVLDILEGIEEYAPDNNRSQVVSTRHNLLVRDAYNANPVSMANAIGSFSSLNTGNKLCILGDMLELGPTAPDEHHAVMRMVVEAGITECYAVGPIFSELAPDYGYYGFNPVDELVEFLRVRPITGKTILVKGSNSIGLERLYPLL